jgi:hypothetical protein
MLVKSSPMTSPKVIPIVNVSRQLADLYSRRSAIEELIHSLEDYSRFRAQRFELKSQKTA